MPGLFTSLKLEVDQRRVPGRFVLTGSTDVLAIPTVQDSLAGRLEAIRLHPVTQCELHAGHTASDGFIDALFGDNFPIRQAERLGTELVQKIVAGGYPPALARPAGRRRANWYRNYIDAQVQRDVGSLSRISGLDALPRLLSMAATQTAQLFNLSRLGGAFPAQPSDHRRLHSLAGAGIPVGEAATLAQQSRETPCQNSKAPHRRHWACLCALGSVRTDTSG